MKRTDIHFFSADALPIILKVLIDRGLKLESYKGVAHHDVRNIESTCPDNCVILKLNYDA